MIQWMSFSFFFIMSLNLCLSCFFLLSMNLYNFLYFLLSWIIVYLSWEILKKQTNIFMLILTIMTFFLYSYNMLSMLIMMEISFFPLSLMILTYSDYFEKHIAFNYFLMYTIISSIPMTYLLVHLMQENYVNFLLWADMFFQLSFMSLFLCIPFFIKMPIFLFHLWLPKAHVMAPVSGSMVLASLSLKLSMWSFIYMSTFFCIYFLLPFFLSLIMLNLLSMFKQSDSKVFVAYSSIFHMTFLCGNLFLYLHMNIKMSLIISMLHSILSPFMFYFVFFYYLKSGNRMISLNNIKFHTSSSFFFSLLFFLLNINFPFTPSFWSEVICFSSFFMFFNLSLLLIIFFIFMVIFLVYLFFFMSLSFQVSLTKMFSTSKIFFKNSFFLIMFFFSLTILYLSKCF